MMTERSELLRDYVETGSEQAFSQLVARHFDMVYSVALRMVGHDAHLAQDVAQSVFTDLARRAPALCGSVVLAGWLYRHTYFTATKLVRTERRRQAREMQAVEMNALNDNSEPNWKQLGPVLDEALSRLGPQDRNAIILRYFDHRPLRAVGDALGTSEEGARKRVDRAVEKLRAFLVRRGVTVSAGALAAALAGQMVTAAPAGLAAVVAGASLAGAASSGTLSITLLKLMTMTKLKIAAATLVVAAGVATPMVVQYQTTAKLRQENTALREQMSGLKEADRARAENAQSANAQPLSNEQMMELMRLRGEVGQLKQELTEVPKLRQEITRLAQRQTRMQGEEEPKLSPEAEQQKATAIAKMNFAKNWLLAFILYADKNNDQFPASFAQAQSFFPAGAEVPPGFTTDQYEIVYKGSISSITNPSPAMAIVLREKEAWPSVNGGWSRAYGFADGHTEIHFSADGNFQPWESQRMYAVGPQ
jgi:RNA polymerase sigma factor (sigma-70 family)